MGSTIGMKVNIVEVLLGEQCNAVTDITYVIMSSNRCAQEKKL